jgi:hypothetical protein
MPWWGYLYCFCHSEGGCPNDSPILEGWTVIYMTLQGIAVRFLLSCISKINRVDRYLFVYPWVRSIHSTTAWISMKSSTRLPKQVKLHFARRVPMYLSFILHGEFPCTCSALWGELSSKNASSSLYDHKLSSLFLSVQGQVANGSAKSSKGRPATRRWLAPRAPPVLSTDMRAHERWARRWLPHPDCAATPLSSPLTLLPLPAPPTRAPWRHQSRPMPSPSVAVCPHIAAPRRPMPASWVEHLNKDGEAWGAFAAARRSQPRNSGGTIATARVADSERLWPVPHAPLPVAEAKPNGRGTGGGG